MSQPQPTHPQPPAPGQLDAVVFEAGTLVDAGEAGGRLRPRAAAGARRLVAALRRRGLAIHVLGPRQGAEEQALRSQLDAAGIALDRLSIVGNDTALARTNTSRVLAVTTSPERSAGLAAAGHPTVALEGRPVHHAVLAWLVGRERRFGGAAALVAPLDDEAVEAARARQLLLTKPPGSLGRLEDVAAQLAGISGAVPPPLPRPAATAVFVGDHGVHTQGVSPWPQEVTAQMVANFLAGGAAVNVLARQVGADVVVVDVGMVGDLPEDVHPAASGLIDRKVRRGTGDLSTGPAMTLQDARRALDAGAEVATLLVEAGARCLVTGDMGIANTTPSAALVASLTERPAAAVTGRGTGVDDLVLTRKTALVAAAAARARYQHGSDPLAILAEVGGLEHAALAGFVVGAAALQVPVVVDGAIAAAALLVASRLVPGVEHCVVAGHLSVEPGASAVLAELGIEPMLDLAMRLGEGTGALLAVPLVEAAARLMHEMATFADAGVANRW
jgi:nicotinate-nucleotide--dimethylbenzimidazole phosphoribosyltransferase